jgi:hypothetical protein
MIDGEWGYMDKAGRVSVGPQFDDASDFRGGLAAVTVNKMAGYINKSGERVWPRQIE